MNEEFVNRLKGIEFDSLTAKEAVELRAVLTEAVAKSDRWMAGLMKDFGGTPATLAEVHLSANQAAGRPPEMPTTSTVVPPHSRAQPAKRRGRPIKKLKVEFNKRRPAPEPIAVGGADSGTPAPRAAEIFEQSYVSKEGPRPGAQLPPDHPRNFARPSSVTPEVDMGDFAEVEAAMGKGGVGKIFQ